MEDNRRSAIAIFLCIVIVLVWTQYIQVTQFPNAGRAQVQVTPQAGVPAPVGQMDASPSPAVSAQLSAAVAAPAPSQTGRASLEAIEKSELLTVETSLVTMQVSRLGGRIYSFKLKGYKKELRSEEPLELVSRRDGSALPLGVYSAQYNDEQVLYAVKASDNALPDGRYRTSLGGELKLEMTGRFPDGSTINKTLGIRDDSFLVKVGVSLPQSAQSANPLWLEWTAYSAAERIDNRIDPEQYTTLAAGGKLETVQLRFPERVKDFEGASWGAFGDKYFMAALVPPEQSGRVVRVAREDVAAPVLAGAPAGAVTAGGGVFSLFVSGAAAGGEFALYAGPKDYRVLRDAGYDLFRGIDLGTFSFISYPLLRLVSIFHGLLANYGLAIILLTLVIKALFLPLTKASFKSMKAMQDIQPEMKALRERIKDPTKLNQEMGALFKKHGVNPMGGCLPIAVQLPVWLGLYWSLSLSIELRHAPFALWINDLSAPEHLELFGIGIPVMVLLMGLSMFLQQLSMPNTAADPTQQKIMMFTPVIFTAMFIIFPMPSGLVLYWLISNVISITQQMFLRKSGGISAELATLIASVGIFAFGYILTLL